MEEIRKVLSEELKNFTFRILYKFRNNGENSIVVDEVDGNIRQRWYMSELPSSIRTRIFKLVQEV